MTCQELGAAQRLLAVGGHQGNPGARAAAVGIADATLMLAQQSTRLAFVDTRLIGQRIKHDIGAVSRNDDQPEAQPPAEFAHVFHALWPLTDGEIDVRADRQAIHTLQYEPKPEGTLQLDDHRRFAAAHADHIATTYLPLDGKSLSLEQRLHGRIEVALQWHGAIP